MNRRQRGGVLAIAALAIVVALATIGRARLMGANSHSSSATASTASTASSASSARASASSSPSSTTAATTAPTFAVSPRDPSFPVSVSTTPVTRPLAGNFLGLALEYNTIPGWVGSPTGPVNPPLVQLVRNLNPGGRPLIRIGGQSTDRSWWPVPGLKQPIGVTYVLGSKWTAQARALAQALNGQLMMGLNLEANRTRIPAQEASHFVSEIGSKYVASFQLGNEPELYLFTPWYRVVSGHAVPWYSKVGTRVFARAPGYGATSFASEFERIAPLLPRNIVLAGPETGSPDFMSEFTHFLSPRSRVRMLTYHAYGNNGCFKTPTNIGYPTIPHLLTVEASRDLLVDVDGFVGIAHANGATFRIDEMGSVTCNGRAGVSDTMASALWAMDSLFAVARAGVDGVNLHSYPDSVNGLFDFTSSHGHWLATVHPLYYGALMFAQAAPAGSRLVQVGAGGGEQIRAWATLGTDKRVRVLVINDNLSGTSNAVIHSPAGYGGRVAPLERLVARGGASAKSGITLGGQQFGQTSTGVLPAPVTQTVTPHSGAYTVAVPASSAVLLTLSHD